MRKSQPVPPIPCFCTAKFKNKTRKNKNKYKNFKKKKKLNWKKKKNVYVSKIFSKIDATIDTIPVTTLLLVSVIWTASNDF